MTLHAARAWHPFLTPLFVTFFLAGVITALIIAVAYAPAMEYWATKKLGILTASPQYYTPTRHRQLLERAPFLEAVITHLKDEGMLAGKKCQFVILETAPISHPTPSFVFRLSGFAPGFDVVGYGFLIHDQSGSLALTGMPITYEDGKEKYVEFSVPPTVPNGRVLILARLSLETATDFPDDLTKILTLSIQ